jgi:hypothetical protein
MFQLHIRVNVELRFQYRITTNYSQLGRGVKQETSCDRGHQREKIHSQGGALDTT